jgi:hypothetical protein
MCTARRSMLGETASSRTFGLGAVALGLLKKNSERESALTLRVFLGSLFVVRGHSGIRFLGGDFESGRRPASRERYPGPVALQELSGQLGNVVSRRLDLVCGFKIPF